MNLKTIAIIGIVALAIFGLITTYTVPLLFPKLHPPDEVHYHADFLLYLNGVPYNFSQAKYMSAENGSDLNQFIHIHDMNGKVIHLHRGGVTLGKFFNSLNMTFNPNCFVLDNGTAYCNSGSGSLKMYVQHLSEDNSTNTTRSGSWEQNYVMNNYQFNDLDRILITYGNETYTQIQEQMKSVGEDACLYSLNCPWKGKLDANENSCTIGSADSCGTD